MDAVREVALPIRQENGVKLAGWYYTDIGKLNRVVHIWAYDDLAHFDKARTAVTSDPKVAEGLRLPRPGPHSQAAGHDHEGRRLFRRASIGGNAIGKTGERNALTSILSQRERRLFG